MTHDRRPNLTDDPTPDLLEQATAALRDYAVPNGPPPQVITATLAALRRGRPMGGMPRRWQFAPWGLPARIAAVLVLAACGVAAALAVARQLGSPKVPFVDHPVPPGPPPPTGPAPTPAPAPLASAGPIRGRVVFDGPPPPPRTVPQPLLDQCAAHVHGPVLDESLVVGPDRGLANVVVSIESGLPTDRPYPAPAAPAILDQSGCMFEPHVVTMQVGQALVARNGDPFLHNVHTLPKANPAANIGQPTVDRRGLAVGPVRSPEIFQVKCNIHPWMTAWVAAFDHPYYAVTRPDGTFALPDLPPGRYVVRAWHEQLGVVEKDVVVTTGKPTPLDFTFEPRHAAATVPAGTTRVLAKAAAVLPCAACAGTEPH